MKRILFVDDEPRILQAMERMLRVKHVEWDMTFALGGEAALELLEKSDFDVIVTDMRMPKIDGAALLKEVQQHCPHIIRIVLSGYSEIESALRALPVAHQFLAKPCNSQHLKDVIDRACNLQTLLPDQTLKTIIGKINQLPILPRVTQALNKALSQPNPNMKDIGMIIEQDIAISAKVLQMVNSAFFGLAHDVSNVRTAMNYIGINMIKNLAQHVEVFPPFNGKNKIYDLSLEKIQKHAFMTANLAQKMFKDPKKSEDAFAAGMLHDIGKLIMMAFLPAQFEQVTKEMNLRNQTDFEVEKQLVGVTHAEIGAYLLGIWGLPYPIVEAVANHHEPTRVNLKKFDVLSALYIANQLVDQEDENFDYLVKLGVLDRLPQWQSWVEELKSL